MSTDPDLKVRLEWLLKLYVSLFVHTYMHLRSGEEHF